MRGKPGLPGGGQLDAASLEALVRLAYDAIIVRRPDSQIVFWNAGAEALYGWSQAEALGQSPHKLLATQFPVPLEQIERELALADRWEGRLRHRTKAGDEIVVESRWALQFGADGELVAVMEVNRDLTARAVAERELAAEAARFRAIFDSSLDAILLTAPDGRIFAANAAAQAMFGRSEEEIVTGGRELLLDRSDPRVAAGLRERAATGRFRGDLRALRRDGTPFEVETSSVVFADASGETRTSTVMHDVTERIRALESARESEARFRALSDAAFEAVFIHDAGRILDVNRAAGALYGYTEQELRTMHVLDLVPPRQAEHAQALLEAPPEEPYEMPAVTADGAELLVEASGRAITFDGRPARVVAVRDITERERVRQTLEEQNQRLRELDALKSEFVALVSHELRTPLTSIIAHLDVLDAGEAGSLNERQRRYLEVAGRNARRLGRLVDDLLLAARADAGQFTIERRPVELAPIAEEVVEELRPTAAAAGVELEAVVAATPIVAGDRERILQLLGNLVVNALDATPAGGAVDVHVDLSGGEAILAVSDTGIGIPAGDHPHLFDRFYRTREATSRAAAGAGLGLAVVKEIVDAHHGTITVDSEPGRGSRFTVRLPLDG